jgi:hypothetical protein
VPLAGPQVRTLAQAATPGVGASAPATVTVLARAPTGNRLAAGYSDGAVRAAGRRAGCTGPRAGLHAGGGCSRPEGAAADALCAPQIRIWNLSNGECTATLHGHKARPFRGPAGPAALSPKPAARAAASPASSGDARFENI